MKQSQEVELKYRVQDESTALALLTRTRVGPCTLGAFQTRRLSDAYYDTDVKAVAAAGYALRFRRTGDRARVQLKSLDASTTSLHQRREIQIDTDEPTRVAAWPAGPERDFVRSIVGDEPLHPLFEIDQIRRVAPVLLETEMIAELSVDDARWSAGERSERAWILEIEFTGPQDHQVIEAIEAGVASWAGLTPEIQSKYEHGMALLDGASGTGGLDAGDGGDNIALSEPSQPDSDRQGPETDLGNSG